MNIRKPVKKILYSVQQNPLSEFIYQNNITKRSKIELTEVLKLSKHINVFAPFTKEINPPNDWYGHAKIFKQFLGLPENYQFKFIIEHGLHLVDRIVNLELEVNLPSFLTYSTYRKKIINRYGRRAFCIGPYICYASHYLTNEQLLKERRRLGKSLLLFPSHSSGDININYDIQELCKKIKKMAASYDSLRVCLYWKDVLRGHADYYQKAGFECVTAGHILDPFFLPRLKSIIEISTITISNTLGNHIGYSIYMNKPHFVIPQMETASGRKSEEKLAVDFQQSELFKKVLKPFVKFTDKITKEQKAVVTYYWGLDQIKNKKEFMRIIQKTEDTYRDTKF